ncbi:MAG TPA: hypothetical protein VLF62_01560 [Candidatus Saccharimonadales bacterium]|nr:hypothetical protein [Candidatus Saccharimonadales bacterium]
MRQHQIDALLPGEGLIARTPDAIAEAFISGSATGENVVVIPGADGGVHTQPLTSTELTPVDTRGALAQIPGRDLWRPHGVFNPYLPRNDEANSERALRMADDRLMYRTRFIYGQGEPQTIAEIERGRAIAAMEKDGDALIAAAQTAVAEVLRADSTELPALQGAQHVARGLVPRALVAAPGSTIDVPPETAVTEPGPAFFEEPRTTRALPAAQAEAAAPEAVPVRQAVAPAIGTASVHAAKAEERPLSPAEAAAVKAAASGEILSPDAFAALLNESGAFPQAPTSPGMPPIHGEKTQAIRWANQPTGNDGAKGSWMMPVRKPAATIPQTEAEAADRYVSVMADVEIPEGVTAAFAAQKPMSPAEFNERMTTINTERASLEKMLEKGEIPPERLGEVKGRVTLLAHQESELLAKGNGGRNGSDNSYDTMERVLAGLRKL